MSAVRATAAFVQRLRDEIGSDGARFGVVDLHELRVVLDELDRLRACTVAVHELVNQVQRDTAASLTERPGTVVVEVANARYDLAAAVRGTLRDAS